MKNNNNKKEYDKLSAVNKAFLNPGVITEKIMLFSSWDLPELHVFNHDSSK